MSRIPRPRTPTPVRMAVMFDLVDAVADIVWKTRPPLVREMPMSWQLDWMERQVMIIVWGERL